MPKRLTASGAFKNCDCGIWNASLRCAWQRPYLCSLALKTNPKPYTLKPKP